MRTETLTEMQEAANNEVHEVYGEVYETYDDLEGKVEQAFNELPDKLYEMQKAAAVTKRTVGAINAIGVRKRQILFDYSEFLD